LQERGRGEGEGFGEANGTRLGLSGSDEHGGGVDNIDDFYPSADGNGSCGVGNGTDDTDAARCCCFDLAARLLIGWDTDIDRPD
jgi:hypothetical protein